MLDVEPAVNTTSTSVPDDHETQPTQGRSGREVARDNDRVIESESDAVPNVHCAGERHNRLRSLHAAGNEVLYGFIQELWIFNDCRQYHELGYPSLAKYCESQFGIGRSTAHDYVRVAKQLAGLPHTRAMFRDGDLSWCQIREITRVATVETETAWIELALKGTVRELVAERKQAERAGRDAPVDRRYGLPNLMVHIGVDVTMEEKQRILAAFACVDEALGEQDDGGGESRDTRPVLLRWADAVLAGTVPVSPAAGGQRSAPAQTILYRSDPDTGRACVETEDGPVEVPAERIEELAPDAVQVEVTADDEEPLPPLEGEIDGPNTDKIRLQTLARDGLKCAHCGYSQDVQVHHKIHRADGGRTALYNLIPLCRACHALVHDDLLDIRGRPGDDLRFIPTPMLEGVRIREVDALCAKVRDLAVDTPTPKPTGADSDQRQHVHHQTNGQHSDRADGRPVARAGGSTISPADPGTVVLPSARPVPDPGTVEQRRALDRRIRMLATGLVRWGYSKREAEEAVSDAYFELERTARSQAAAHGDQSPDDPPPNPPEITDEDILRLALFNQAR